MSANVLQTYLSICFVYMIHISKTHLQENSKKHHFKTAMHL